MAHTFFYDPSFDYSSITLSGKRAGTDKKRQKFPHMYLCLLKRICYSHWANGARNGVISIGQWGVFNHEKGAI